MIYLRGVVASMISNSQTLAGIISVIMVKFYLKLLSNELKL